MGSVYVYLFCCFFFTDTATTEIYTYRHTLSLHDALPIFASSEGGRGWSSAGQADDRRHVLHDALGGVEPDHGEHDAVARRDEACCVIERDGGERGSRLGAEVAHGPLGHPPGDRKSKRLNSSH